MVFFRSLLYSSIFFWQKGISLCLFFGSRVSGGFTLCRTHTSYCPLASR